RQPVEPSSQVGKRSLAVLGFLAVIAALIVAFEVGRAVEAGSEDRVYSYVAIGGDGPYSSVHAFPQDDTVLRVLSAGERVDVDCRVKYEDGSWLRLAYGEGWLKETEFSAAPHTGQGAPPSCPDW